MTSTGRTDRTGRGAGSSSTPQAPLSGLLAADLVPGVHRFRSRSATSAVLSGLERAGWAISVIDLAKAADKAAILDAVARGLAFPGWVGRNWDALDDALRDLSWWPAGALGRAIIIRGSGRSTTGAPRDREQLQDVLAKATDRWAATDTPLVVLLRR